MALLASPDVGVRGRAFLEAEHSSLLPCDGLRVQADPKHIDFRRAADYQALTPSKRASGFSTGSAAIATTVVRRGLNIGHGPLTHTRGIPRELENKRINENKNNWFGRAAFSRGSRNVFREQPNVGHVETERKQIHFR